MSEAKHTPGPWEAKDHGVVVGGDDVELPYGNIKCQLAAACIAQNITTEERDANTRLIAAAPDLLEACEAAERARRVPMAIVYKLRKAIAKATGGAK